MRPRMISRSSMDAMGVELRKNITILINIYNIFLLCSDFSFWNIYILLLTLSIIILINYVLYLALSCRDTCSRQYIIRFNRFYFDLSPTSSRIYYTNTQVAGLLKCEQRQFASFYALLVITYILNQDIGDYITLFTTLSTTLCEFVFKKSFSKCKLQV